MSFLDHVINLVPVAAISPLAAEERNIVLIPAGPPPAVRNGALGHGDAGPPGGDGPPQRVVAVLGPGATFAGIADVLMPRYADAASSSSGGPAAPTLGELARAIVVYAKDYLNADDWVHHTVGVILPLPIEIDPGSGAWIVDADRVRALAASFTAAWRRRLRTPPGALAVPDALALEADAFNLASTVLPVAALAAQLWTRALRNPSEAVLMFLAALRALDGKGAGPGVPGQAAAAALAALNTATAEQLSVLAATSAGNGILRRFAALLTPPPAGAEGVKTLLDNALRQGGVLVVHRDVPETAAQQASRPGTAKPAAGAAADPPGGIHRLVLGRDVAVGRSAAERVSGVTYTGPAFTGRVALQPYLTADAANLDAGSDPDTAALLVLLAGRTDVALLDSVQARGTGLVTAGLGHWGATDGTGLPALLHAYKNAAPDEFDLFFALHGLDVQPGPAGGPQHQLLLIGPDGTGTVPTGDALRSFLGGRAGAQGAVAFSSDWAARFRLPAVVSAAHRRVQVAQAAPRAGAAASEFEKATARFGPFPAGYSIKFSTSTRLHDALMNKMTGGKDKDRAHADPGSVIGRASHDGAVSAGTLVAALVDLTDGFANPPYAGFDDGESFYVGSMAKIGPMYAAFELRYRLRQLIAGVRAAKLDTAHKDWLTFVRQAIGKVWGPQICRDFFPGFDAKHLNTRYPDTFPDLKAMFSFGADGSVDFATMGPTGDASVKATGENGAVPSGMKFLEWMKLMIHWSNNEAAARVINSINYPYINHVLREAGFFDPVSERGIWVSQNYGQGIWKKGPDLMPLSPLGVLQYKAATNFTATAHDVASLLTLAAVNKLFGGDKESSSQDMVLLMRQTFPNDTAPPNPVGTGLPEPFAGAIGLTAGGTVRSKVGIGDALRAFPFHSMHDCVIIERTTTAGTRLHYVAVLLGGWEDEPLNVTYWSITANALDASIAAMH